MDSRTVIVIGGGIAGSEAALQLAHAGIPVVLYEMRPKVMTPAHTTEALGELVCSNSFKGVGSDSAPAALKDELSLLGSQVIDVAYQTRVPAGSALAVDRAEFASELTRRVVTHPGIDLRREEVTSVPAGVDLIVATGPLTSPALASDLDALVGGRLAFFDAAAPVVDASTVDEGRAFCASRYGKGEGSDYLNCPLDRATYNSFIQELVSAQRVIRKDFEPDELFQACQPIEEIARKGLDALRYGPMRPVGLVDPRTGVRPWAVAQLRPENRARTAYNIVGFQTNLTFLEQRRVFSMIPGLQNASFLRYGVMHRNTFIDAPRLVDATLALREHPRIRVAGQLLGTEGYLEAAGTGLLAALNVIAARRGAPPVLLPIATALGSLVGYATDQGTSHYQPMHVNWGLVPPLALQVSGKRSRHEAYRHRAREELSAWRQAYSSGPRDTHSQGSSHA